MSRYFYFALIAALALFFFGCASTAQQGQAGFTNNSSAVSMNASQPVIVFTCPDGTLVTDASECDLSGQNASYVCPDGKIVLSASDCGSCKTSCDDSDPCTVDICSSQTNYECIHVRKSTPECDPGAIACAGGSMVDGKCVCLNESDLPVNGACKKSFCIIDWGGGRSEKLSPGECSASYYNDSNERPFCDFNVEVTTDCSMCGCQGGVACVDGKCAPPANATIPADATPLYQPVDNYGIRLVPKLVSVDRNVSFSLADSNGVTMETFDMVPVGTTVAKRISNIGYVNFTLTGAGFNMDTRYQWARFAFNAYTLPCIPVSQKKSLKVKAGTMQSYVEYLATAVNESGATLRERSTLKPFTLAPDSNQTEIPGAKGLYASLCAVDNSTAYVTISSSRPFDMIQVTY